MKKSSRKDSHDADKQTNKSCSEGILDKIPDVSDRRARHVTVAALKQSGNQGKLCFQGIFIAAGKNRSASVHHVRLLVSCLVLLARGQAWLKAYHPPGLSSGIANLSAFI
jgi:hypothetical protein